MFFKKKPKLSVAPLGYWEEKSYMIIIVKEENKDFLKGISERISSIEGVEFLGCEFGENKKTVSIKVTFEDEDFELNFASSEFRVPEYYLRPSIVFKEKDIEELRKSTKAITLYMDFHRNAKKSYHLQLKIAYALVPEMLAVMDESSERLLSPKWVKMVANSKIEPSSKDLFTVQVVSEDSGSAWLHTHGLCRCGLTELEILDSNVELANSHYNLICTYGMFLIDKIEDKSLIEEAYIGRLINGEPIVVTTRPWIEGLNEYKGIDLGGEKDRLNGHNSKSNIIFLYKSEEDEKNGIISKVSIYNDLWNDNPIYFISDEETKRMQDLAREKFDYVKKAFLEKKYEVDIKIGLLVDSKENFEHIWFKLLEIKGSKFKAELLQEPYNVSNMHPGDVAWYEINNVTDWLIYTKEFSISPASVFLMDEE